MGDVRQSVIIRTGPTDGQNTSGSFLRMMQRKRIVKRHLSRVFSNTTPPSRFARKRLPLRGKAPRSGDEVDTQKAPAFADSRAPKGAYRSEGISCRKAYCSEGISRPARAEGAAEWPRDIRLTPHDMLAHASTILYNPSVRLTEGLFCPYASVPATATFLSRIAYGPS
jgi:hypothetical protein